jgi:hypothetical protein
MNVNDYDTLKAYHRDVRDTFPDNLRLRVHRALSWLQRAEHCDDDDGRFIFLWIAFNAAYGCDIHDDRRFSERNLHHHFIKQLCQLDTEHSLYNLVWHEFSGSIRLLLGNRYIYQPYWEYQRGNLEEVDWILRIVRAGMRAKKALANQDTGRVLAILFNRLYTLRNQLIHGGATWNSSVNRTQVRDGASILGKVVPELILLMMQHPEEVWGEPTYPVTV